MMRGIFIDEPELEFGSAGRHIDIRHGLIEHGPLDRGTGQAPQNVRVGVIGAAADIERFDEWLDGCRNGVEAKASQRRTLFVEFPGFGEGRPLCDFLRGERLSDVIAPRDVDAIATLARNDFSLQVTERFSQGASHLIDNANADVVVCLLPEVFVRRIDVPDAEEKGPRSSRPRRSDHNEVWHDAFKARSLRFRRPIQVLRPAVYGGAVQRFTRAGKAAREVQDEATRAWNFFVALYYKAGGVPWRLVREATDLATCYVGISFYVDPASETLRTSVAQVFNERGEGMIVRGGAAQLDERDKTPHLTASDAQSLLEAALKEYRREHRTSPARLVCHKSSYFSDAELAGCKTAADAANIDAMDLLSIRKSRTRLYRAGPNPPLRGTALIHDDGCLLYTQGSVDFYRCYPGLYVPTTLDVRLDSAGQGEKKLLSEILALTKMNWNSTDLINLEPITIAAARHVGGILRHVPPGEVAQGRFSFYM
jgi:hypothetical protein